MRRFFSGLVTGLFLVVGGIVTPGVADAQQAPGAAPTYDYLVSANPFGLLLEIFNVEFEMAVTESSTAGIGGSYWGQSDEDYLNADLFWRFYLGGDPFEGWAFGTKAGLTSIPDEGTFFGIGFDLNHSWLAGRNDNFYVGVGFGLKRLLGTGDVDLDLAVIPTIRLVNVGIAF